MRPAPRRRFAILHRLPQPPRIDPARTAVVVIDMQRDFLDAGAPVATPGGLDLIPRINRLTARARVLGMPVLFTQEMHRGDKSDFGIELEFEPPHCLEGTPGMDLAGQLDVAPDDYRILNKRRYDAFLGTDLETLLRSLRIENLLLAGVCTDICVTSTVQHARNSTSDATCSGIAWPAPAPSATRPPCCVSATSSVTW